MTDIAVESAPVRAGVLPLKRQGDDALARRAAAGDTAAFAQIYERYHQGLYRYCLSIVGSPEDAADALQATMAKALTSIGSQDQAGALKAWLYRIAHNESITLLRARRPQDELDDELPGLAAPEHDAATRARLETLVTDLKALPDRQRSALVLRELSGLEYAEIAAALATTPATAKQAVYEARVALQDLSMGRELPCETVQRALSDGDGRRLRGRKLRAHLRSCSDCQAFRTAIDGRRNDFNGLFPVLPAAGAAAILAGVLGGGGGGGAAGGGGLAVASTGARFGLGKILGVAAAGAATAAVAAGAIAVVNHDHVQTAARGKAAPAAPAPPKPPAAKPVNVASAPAPAVDAYGGDGGEVVSGVDGTGGAGGTGGADQATAAATAGGALPFTGSDTVMLVLAGLALLAVGLALRRAARAD